MSAKTALAIRHVLFEHLGILDTLLGDRGFSVQYLDAGLDTIDAATVTDADLLVVLGGPIGAYDTARYPWLAQETAAIGARLQAGAPTLGICLGAQLMALALGADVAPTGRTEIGYAPLSLGDAARTTPLRHLDGVPVLHWHGDEFTVPDGASLLASTPGFPHQAFALGPSILGLQFHLETPVQELERWLIGHAVELASAGIDPVALRRAADDAGPRLEEAARLVFAEWLDG